MKKILALILTISTSLILMLSLVSCGNNSQDDDENLDQTYFKYFDYELTEDESAYIVTGYGVQLEKEITIPSKHEGLPVIGIARQAFKKNLTITKVVIPDSITYIETEAFYGCTELKSITLGKGLKTIGQAAFEKCNQVKQFLLPEGLTEIGDRAFAGCTAIESINIPSTVTRVGEKAFMSTKYMSRGASNYFHGVFVLDNWVIYTDSDTFHTTGEAFLHANLPDNVVGIADNVFFRAEALESVEIPANVKYIGKDAFSACTSLITVEYPLSYASWLDIKIGSGNENLLNADLNYKYN